MIEEKSALSAVIDGEVKDGECLDVSITSRDENFNGICVGGKGPYTVSGADVSLMGNGGNDFIGYGAGIMSGDDAVLTVEDSCITTKGAARGAMFCRRPLQALYVKNCEERFRRGRRAALGSTRTMSCPAICAAFPGCWVSGAICRATNLADYADALYEDCTLTSEAWGVMLYRRRSPLPPEPQELRCCHHRPQRLRCLLHRRLHRHLCGLPHRRSRLCADYGKRNRIRRVQEHQGGMPAASP